ncbi:hypothetical protein CDD83_8775 [Cordyceps sp. RAO-2017]|nr:hypothetical protein CDD83_8775 [Cordyceps sp. RAO-2017]
MKSSSRSAHSSSAGAATARPSENRTSRADSKPVDIPKLSQATRTASCSSNASSARSHTLSSSSLSSSPRKSPGSWIKSTPTVNVHTTCGRHTDQYMFGGPSLSEMARSIMRKS